jgi:hypothetical protein
MYQGEALVGAEKAPQLRFLLESILNVAQRLRLGAFIGCGLAGWPF